MASIISTCTTVLRQSFRPLVRAHGASQLISNALAYLTIPALPALAFFLQSHIPGVENLYPWAFPLIVANSVLTVMVFVAAVRLQLPRDRATQRLAELRSEGVAKRIKGRQLFVPPPSTPSFADRLDPHRFPNRSNSPELTLWIGEYSSWEKEVHDEINKLSPVQAELWATLGDVPLPTGNFYNSDHARYMAFFNEGIRRLEEIIERFRQQT